MFNNISTVFYILGSSGFITFMGRVMEVQFNTSSASGSILTGPITILGMTVGLLISGYVITKCKPPPKYLFLWNVGIGLLSMCAAISYTQLGCNRNNSLMVNGTLLSCNSNCVCDGITYSPVCDRDTRTTYFSPCHAGCTAFNDKDNFYTNCSCTKSVTHKRSTPRMFAENRIDEAESAATSRAPPATTASGFDTTEQRITLYDVYDEELRPHKGPHDDNEMIDVNALYDVSYEDDDDDGDDLNSNELNDRKRRQPPHMGLKIYPGACVGDCKFAYYTFSLISMVSSLISSTGRIGNILLNFR